MQKISSSTTTANADGEFTNGSPGAGVSPTLIMAEWLNAVQRELISVLQGAGLAVDPNKNDQVLSAIRAINKQRVVLADTGTAVAYKAVNTPPLTSFPPSGFTQCINIANVNTGAATYAPDGLAAKPIYGLALQPLQGGELARGIATLEYLVQAGVNGGNGAWIVIDAAGGSVQVPKATKSNQAVSLSQLGNYSGLFGTSASNSLTTNNLGQLVTVAAPGTTQTLPSVATLTPGSAITFSAWGGCTIKAADSELISGVTGTNASAITLNAGEQITLTTNGVSWYTSSYSPASCSGTLGQILNARMSVTAVSSIAVFSADEVPVKSALGGASWMLSALSKQINLSTNGPGGMDTGAAPSNGAVAVYACFNPSLPPSLSNPMLLAQNATSSVAPEVYTGNFMPAGYTASALVSVWRTTAGGAFTVGEQMGRRITWVSNQVLSTTVPQAGYTAFSVSGMVPKNAKWCSGFGSISNSVASANSYGQLSGSSAGVGEISIAANPVNAVNGGVQTPFPDIPLVTPQTLFYKLSTTSGTATLLYSISGYTF